MLQQSKMKKSTNHSSICQNTTLLSLSNVSVDESESPYLNQKHHELLLQKIRELQGILEATNTEKFHLKQRHQQLLDEFAIKKSCLDRISLGIDEGRRDVDNINDDFSESGMDEGMAETCKIGYNIMKSKEMYKCNRQTKNHKFYSAIQSPAVSYSPDRFQDHYTLNYCKSRYYPESTTSKGTGMIRKQRDNLRQKPSGFQFTSPSRTNYQTIDDIWNESKPDSKRFQKSFKQKSIKSFL